MKRTWMVAALAMAMSMAAGAGPRKPPADALVTVFTYNRVGVPEDVLARARQVATAAFATAGIEVKWVEGRRLGGPRNVAGDALTVLFDGPAPANLPLPSVAVTYLGGRADADVRVFYYRMADVADMRAQRSAGLRVRMPEFLGNVLAHELTHALEGVARHSSQGLMKALWSSRDWDGMACGALPFAAEDLKLLRAHFQKRVPPAAVLVSSR